MRFDTIGLAVPEILVPKREVDLNRWAVVACDQYTSEPEYWNKTAQLVDQSPSTLKMILPELYLDTPQESEMIDSIHATMRDYLNQEILTSLGEGFVLLDRSTPNHPSRKGLMVALDLERYQYEEGSQPLIRATEGTIVDRLPPRVRVREAAPLELPHIMVLIDDPDHTVIEPLFNEELPEIYNFELMQGSGHLRGYFIQSQQLLQQIADRLEALINPTLYTQRYGVENQPPMLYAMGDGNHSLATAKAIWEEVKASGGDAIREDHPARYALVELVNLHDPGIEFEAIHRTLFNTSFDELVAEMHTYFEKEGQSVQIHKAPHLARAEEMMEEASSKAHTAVFVVGDQVGLLEITPQRLSFGTAEFQLFLDDYLAKNAEAKIDYIHGTAVVERLAAQPDTVGLILPPIPKDNFFRSIIHDGVFPRKTFSMGEAHEKRYYLEARRISTD
jgi:hypothetical protein